MNNKLNETKTSNKDELLKLRFDQFCNIWQSLCQLHTDLFDLSCDEYVHLLASNIEGLDETVVQKNELLEKIDALDLERSLLLEKLNKEELLDSPVDKASVLIKEFFTKKEIIKADQLEKLNLLLIDIIENIQKQNKKNQLFLNKAMMSLNDLKDSFTGQKTITTYGPQGKTITKSV
jgi:flagellar biosynthesis/type III secretory pathway chaperone